jgi:hypothetical protein
MTWGTQMQHQHHLEADVIAWAEASGRLAGRLAESTWASPAQILAWADNTSRLIVTLRQVDYASSRPALTLVSCAGPRDKAGWLARIYRFFAWAEVVGIPALTLHPGLVRP